MQEDLSLAKISELVCTRISHDLVGNVGAVSNAVELLDEDPESVDEVKPILDFSSKVLSSRLKFFRVAFGLDNAAVKNIAELKEIADNYIQTIGSRNFPISLNLQITTPQVYKIVLLGIMGLSDCFIKGGVIEVVEKTSGIIIKATSEHQLSNIKVKIIENFMHGTLCEDNPALLAPLVYLKTILKQLEIAMDFSSGDFEAVLKIG